MPATTTPARPSLFPRAELSQQQTIRLPLPIVKGNKDYANRERLLRRMDALLQSSGVERSFLADAVDEARRAQQGVDLTDAARDRILVSAQQTLRCTIARVLSEESHRSFSAHLAESPLLQWFCRCRTLGEVRVPSKSQLHRMEAEVSREVLQALGVQLLDAASTVDAAGQSLVGLRTPVDLGLVWMDSTCAELDIHYPNDWALLRDGTRSVMQSIEVIRRHGLRIRMPSPKRFIAQMNQQAIAMGMASRKGRGREKAATRKATLRAMKRILRKVLRHGHAYRDRLALEWKTATNLSEQQAQQILGRLDHVLEMLPIAQRNAHDRIIGGRMIANDDKILSLFQPHARVYVRGKAGADVEFGLQMVVSETIDGLIIDGDLRDGTIRNDSALLIPTLKRIRDEHGPQAATGVITDRGFSSAANSQALHDLGISDGTLPRGVAALAEAMTDPRFRRQQRRRAQTEGRIGIFKANFLRQRLPVKSLSAQQRFVAWAALAHNLWVLARLDEAKTTAKTNRRAA